MKLKQKVKIEIKLAGGVSTLESGFRIAWTSGNTKVLCFGANKNGEVFVKFFKDKTVVKVSDCSRAELEAIEGIKTLILKW